MSQESTQSCIHHLIWLDHNIENNSNRRNLKQLHELDDQIKSFTDKEQCIAYINKQNTSKTKPYIILIISGRLSEEVIPYIHDCICLFDIFIFCADAERLKHLKFAKLRAICTDFNELFDRIQNCMDRNKFTIDFSLFNNTENNTNSEIKLVEEKSEEQYPIRNLKEDQARFLWFYKCHNFMMELEDDNQQAKQEMISSCRKKYKDDERALTTIDEFENQSLHDNAKNAISWYTKNSIIFRCINEVIVSGNISKIYSYRYIIKLLCRQLKDLHETYKKIYSENILRLYRGQRLKLSQILLISKHKNDLISLNGFISTSLEEDIAKRFCFGRSIEDHEPVIFIIDIDMTNEQSTAFADISNLSRYPDEEEILLSIGSIFCIESVKFDETKQLYRIHLSLSQHNKLTVNKYIEQTFAKEIDSINQSVVFGKLLFDMGEYQFAIEYLKNRINYLSDNDNHYRATYFNNIGVCYNEIGKKDEALKYYKAANQIYQQANNHRGIGACCHNIASYYFNQGDNETALGWALDALEKRQKYQLEKASTLDLLGCIQLAKYDVEAASNNLQEALRIRIKYLGQINPNHPDIGISYRNLGKLDTKLSSFIDAQNNYLRAEEIFRHNYPKSHPLVIEIEQYLQGIKQYFSH
ncbi:unnamed protein product [Adineta steineri]|uniref:NAD(P)(+)--arginine ADP-ribosyltransferase n=1 Tax=Adineta steineri TaxID=433720 RepID=A0A813XLD2_9BILA|nr:unnamed protein product [Adineta steineri]